MITSRWILPGEDAGDAWSIIAGAFSMSDAELVAAKADMAYATFCVMYDEEEPAAAGAMKNTDDGFCLMYICSSEKYRGQLIADLMTRLMLWKTVQFTDRVIIKDVRDAGGFFARYGFREQADGTYLLKKDDLVFPSKCGGQPHA